MLRSKSMREGRRTKSENPTTKISPLPGAIDARMVRCGKPNCRCATAELHGPYYLRRWRVAGVRRSKHVKKQDVLSMKTAVETYRRQQKQARAVQRQSIQKWRDLNALLRSMRI